MSSLVESFVAGLHAGARERFSGDATASALAAAWEAAQTTWPGVALAPERFAADLARRLGADATPAALAQACTADVYLAIACMDGDAAALEHCRATCTREAGLVGARLRATADQVAEASSHLTRMLLIDEPERAAALRNFSGRGNLRAYARVVITRTLARAINAGRREVAGADEILERLATLHDPELSVLKARYHGAVSDAMRAALASLDDRSRALLRYQVVDGWSIDKIGRAYGIHRATAARWLVGAREALAEAIQEELARHLEVDPDEVASIIRLVQSRVDVSLERLLGE